MCVWEQWRPRVDLKKDCWSARKFCSPIVLHSGNRGALKTGHWIYNSYQKWLGWNVTLKCIDMHCLFYMHSEIYKNIPLVYFCCGCDWNRPITEFIWFTNVWRNSYSGQMCLTIFPPHDMNAALDLREVNSVEESRVTNKPGIRLPQNQSVHSFGSAVWKIMSERKVVETLVNT